jgi:predicted TIM-barrel fold metal-dependent hydrolase
MSEAMQKPLVIVSCDSHIGPRLEEDLRPYCPKNLLDDYDAFCREFRAHPVTLLGLKDIKDGAPPALMKRVRVLRTNAGRHHYDIQLRLREMDRDGTAAEVIFPSSQNGEPIPFLSSSLAPWAMVPAREKELGKVAAGIRIYNSWLADGVKSAPERLIGAAVLPQWDVDLCVKEVVWARKAGLRAVTWFAWREGFNPYDHPSWEPLYAACEDLGMPLCAHAGSPFPTPEDVTPASMAMLMVENGGVIARQSAWRLLFAGVFEKHPKLKVILTEQNSDGWWAATMREWDSVYEHIRHEANHLKRKPSEYARDNIFIGASFMAPFEAKDAVDNGYVDNMIWGRDYPHIEGTYIASDDDDIDNNTTRLSMRYAFSSLPKEAIRKMAGKNGIRAYGLDATKLLAVANRIKAPSLKELTTPIKQIPDNGGLFAFRRIGAWS